MDVMLSTTGHATTAAEQDGPHSGSPLQSSALISIPLSTSQDALDSVVDNADAAGAPHADSAGSNSSSIGTGRVSPGGCGNF